MTEQDPHEVRSLTASLILSDLQAALAIAARLAAINNQHADDDFTLIEHIARAMRRARDL